MTVDRRELIANLRLPLDRLPDPLPIPVIERPFDVAIRPPGSKSLTNRALLLAALAEGTSTLRNALVDADDARVMIAAIEKLGARVERRGGDLLVTGVAGTWRVPREGVTINLNNAGTATRFLAAAAILAPSGSGGITIDGNARMRERPIGELVALLRDLGVRVDELGKPGCPPVCVHPAELGALRPVVSVGTTASSQFISALMLVAPMLPRGLRLEFTGEVTSRSYIDMTGALLGELGIEVREAGNAIEIVALRIARAGARPALYRFEYDVEPDASGATYFWAAAAIVPGSSCVVTGLREDSIQGDTQFAFLLARSGAVLSEGDDGLRIGAPAEALYPLVASLALMPDAAMTLAAACCFAPGRTILAGLRTLRAKETDRLAALESELRKVGVTCMVGPMTAYTPSAARDDEALSLVSPAGGIDCSLSAPRVDFDTYDDHRMAMSLALIGLRRPNVFMRNPACVAKTYPTYWNDLAKLYEGVTAG